VSGPSGADLDRAWRVVSAQLEPTPLLASRALGDGIQLKLETWQPTGAFKVRGALAALSRESPAGAGVVTASTGNHALGVAFAADRLGVPATVVVPENASPAKLAALGRFRARVVTHGDSYDAAERHALDLAQAGPRFLSSCNDPDVIAGQATIGTELLAQVPGPVTVICGVGGGGLAAGLGLAAARGGRMTVVGVESDASLAVSTAIRAGRVTPVEVRPSLADGLAGNLEPGSVTPGLIREHLQPLISVTDEQIADAIRFLVREHGLVAEGAGAVPVAALLAGKIPGPAVAVISGRNIAPQTLARLLEG
jgi:threonine dehydratase